MTTTYSPNFTEQYHNVLDRSRWRSGPWDDETLDKAVWVDDTTGLDCMIHRGGGGAWCGYVGVPNGHLLFGQDFDEDFFPAVNGGLTFAASCDEDASPEDGICHLSDEGPVWWLGFDCSHGWDVRPEDDPRFYITEATYKDIDFVISEVQSLAQQVVDYTATRA